MLSGETGDLPSLNFLNIENKFSKQGYHNNSTTKKGDIMGLKLCIFIKIKPINIPNK